MCIPPVFDIDSYPVEPSLHEDMIRVRWESHLVRGNVKPRVWARTVYVHSLDHSDRI